MRAGDDTVDAAGERFTYQAQDQYTVLCQTGTDVGATNIEGFEAALSVGDTITIGPYLTDGISVIALVDVDDSHPACGRRPLGPRPWP